jgi:GNAT superfamily N-acetyltransferase
MIRRLREEDLAPYVALRRASLLDTPLAFAASPESDFVATTEAARQSLIFGAFDGDEIVGCVGLLRERHPKAAHKAHVWGMYVLPSHRRRGYARALLDAAIAHARSLGIEWLHLGATSAAADARRVYERAGFVQWGTETDALRYEGVSVDEARMALDLRMR